MELNRLILIISSIDTANTVIAIISTVVGIISTAITTALAISTYRLKKAEKPTVERPKLWTPGDPEAGFITTGMATTVTAITTIAWYLL